MTARRTAVFAAMPAALLAAVANAQLEVELRAEHRQRLAALQPRIDAAIDKGVAWLLDAQLRDGSWGHEQRWFPTGQTALCAYTLMKAGLPASHSAVQRALVFCASARPNMVYAAGCQLLAFAESADPAYGDAMRRIVDDLIDWQEGGSWGYPNPRGDLGHLHSDRDLSITQFALLGLWAASRAGIEIPARVWHRALDAAIDYQESPRLVDDPRRATGRTRSGQREIAGFRYRFSDRGAPSASMTTAGVAAVCIARAQAGERLARSAARRADEAIARGVAWLDHHYSVTENPGGGREWHYYYLYGLERVAALVGFAYLGDRPWYLDGADELVRLQQKDGNWEHRRHGEPDTCFAILFLRRATAPTTGKAARDPHVSIAEAPEHALGLRARGGSDGSPLDMWLTRIGPPRADGLAPIPPVVERVEYLVDGAVVATVEGGARPADRSATFLARHRFEANGTHRISARAHVRDDADPPQRSVLESPGFELRVDHVLEPWMLPAASRAAENLLLGVGVEASASSRWNDDHGPGNAADQLEATAWCCAPDDARPELELEFESPMRTASIEFHQANGQRSNLGHFDRITRVALRLNRTRDGVEIELDPDELEPTRYALPKATTVRRLSITVLARERGSRHGGVGGFGEILLLP